MGQVYGSSFCNCVATLTFVLSTHCHQLSLVQVVNISQICWEYWVADSGILFVCFETDVRKILCFIVETTVAAPVNSGHKLAWDTREGWQHSRKHCPVFKTQQCYIALHRPMYYATLSMYLLSALVLWLLLYLYSRFFIQALSLLKNILI